MNEVQARTPYHFLAATALVFPGLCALVFVLHFHAWTDFTSFHWKYTPAPPDRVVAHFIRAANHWPMIHDPHVLAYLSLPLMILSAWSLHALGRRHRPALSSAALFLTLSGIVYLGGLFGMWTAFFRGLGNVDPKFTDGAVATFTAMTANSGAFLLTTTLAKLGFIGLAVQALVLVRLKEVPNLAIAAIAVGSATVLTFWDQDNWMLLGVLVMGAGFWPVRKRLQLLGGTSV